MYPIAAVLATERAAAWMEADGFAHMSTFGGAEVGCIAALRCLEITTRPEVRTMSHHIAAFFTEGLDRIQAKYPDWFTGRRQDGLVMGLEFAHPEGAKFVMRRLYSRGVWAIFSTLDPHVLQYKPGLLLDPALCAEILEITETAIGEARDDAAAVPEVSSRSFAGEPDIPLRDLPSFPADPAARAVLTGQLDAWAVGGDPPYPHPSNAR
jgi:acetylornithine/succinyldiaminopimelate/putrescine aminotransferase